MANNFVARMRSCDACIHHPICSHQREYKEYFDEVTKTIPEETDMFHVLVECKYYKWHLESSNNYYGNILT